MKTDEELVKEAVDGNNQSFEEIVFRYEKLIFSIAMRMFNNVEDAKDITQEVFIKIYKNMEGAMGRGSFKSWICTVTTNTSIDELRKRKRKKTVPMEKSQEFVDQEPVPLEQIINDEKKVLIENAIDKLSPEEKQIVILRDVQTLSYDEIKDSLNLTLGTVKSRIFRARKKLQTIYTELSNT